MQPSADLTFHVVRFDAPDEARAFVHALQRFLDSPRGEAWRTKFHITEVWAPSALSARPLELFLSDSALMATEAGFGPVTIVAASRGNELPAECVLLLKGAELQFNDDASDDR